MSLFAFLRDRAGREPRRPALRAGDRRLTYGELLAAVERRADDLEETATLVALEGSDPLRFLVDFFAARRRGLWAISHLPATPPALRAIREEAVRRGARRDGPPATVFFSSGSVGPSRAVPLSDESLASAALAFESWGEVTPEDRVAVGLSPAQILGLVRGALNGLLVGAEAVFFAPRRDPLAEGARLGATAVLVPSALVSLAARHESREAVAALRCGGGRLPEAAAEAVEGVRGVRVRTGYGLTESAGLGARQPDHRPRRAGSSGLPAPGMEIAIVGEDGRDCSVGEPGEIRLRGAAVFSGYLSPADPSPFDGTGRLRTGDLGCFDASGELHVRGRLAFALSAGDRVLCAEEVESALAEHPGVAEAAAAPIGRSFGVLVVVHDASDALLAEIRAHAERRLPSFARPRRIVRAAEIPRTASGKVDRIAVSRWLSARRASA